MTGAWGAGFIKKTAQKSSGDGGVAPFPQGQAGGTVNGDWGGSTTVVFKDSKHPKEATEFAEWISDNEQSAEMELSGGGAYPALLTALSSPTINSPQPFYGNQVINQAFQQGATQLNESFVWGPTMNKVCSD